MFYILQGILRQIKLQIKTNRTDSSYIFHVGFIIYNITKFTKFHFFVKENLEKCLKIIIFYCFKKIIIFLK